MNKVILTGNLANDPESRTTQSGISQCTFRIAVQRPFANQQGVREADFLAVVCWRQSADFAKNYLSKGNRVAIEGSVQTRSYDAQDGSKHYVTEIIADRVETLETRSEAGKKASEKQPIKRPLPKLQVPKKKAEPDDYEDVDLDEVIDDELPF